MSTRIAVRLPDELVAFVDERVARGDASSRASLITRALEREKRLQTAQADSHAFTQFSDEDLDALAPYGLSGPGLNLP